MSGFVLGTGEKLRTLEVFAGPESRADLYQQVQQSQPHTEMCCFWMNPAFHKKTWLNFFIWLCAGYALQTFIYTGPRKHCLLGVAQILMYKMKRLGKLAERKNKLRILQMQAV